MVTEEDVNYFLREFKEKMKIYEVLFIHREKNTNTLLALEITPNKRIEILKALQAKDYSEGPMPEILYNGADMWVFGYLLKKKEIYIKITMGQANNPVICISFHIAEHKMSYPFKTNKHNEKSNHRQRNDID